MVDLDPLDAEDVVLLQELVSNHYQYTKSTVAKFILDDLENQVRNFIKVYPKDYKKVIQTRSQKLKAEEGKGQKAEGNRQ
jgi:glutamate synthase (NADPH/NADH) large chain